MHPDAVAVRLEEGLARIEERLARIEASNTRIEHVCDVLLDLAAPFVRGRARAAVLALMVGRSRT